MFIVLEGIDGSGKSSILPAAREFYERRGRAVTVARDPGSTALSGRIRELLLTPADTPIAPTAETLLYCAARAQMLAEIILPALARNETVICDRFYWSTLAYQGEAGGGAALDALVVAAAGGLRPDLTILLDLPASVAMTRLSGALDRIERRGVDYLERVRRRYLQIIGELPAPQKIILNAAAPREIVHAELLARLGSES
ncbi:thymidylate kinase [Planctomycetales bacterium]|nr:thymidylate kinase [Planctomycetales bacterium]